MGPQQTEPEFRAHSLTCRVLQRPREGNRRMSGAVHLDYTAGCAGRLKLQDGAHSKARDAGAEHLQAWILELEPNLQHQAWNWHHVSISKGPCWLHLGRKVLEWTFSQDASLNSCSVGLPLTPSTFMPNFSSDRVNSKQKKKLSRMYNPGKPEEVDPAKLHAGLGTEFAIPTRSPRIRALSRM